MVPHVSVPLLSIPLSPTAAERRRPAQGCGWSAMSAGDGDGVGARGGRWRSGGGGESGAGGRNGRRRG